MKIARKILILAIVAVLLFAAVMASLFLTEYLDTESEAGAPVTLVVPQGTSGRVMAGILKDAGIIRF